MAMVHLVEQDLPRVSPHHLFLCKSEPPLFYSLSFPLPYSSVGWKETHAKNWRFPFVMYGLLWLFTKSQQHWEMLFSSLVANRNIFIQRALCKIINLVIALVLNQWGTFFYQNPLTNMKGDVVHWDWCHLNLGWWNNLNSKMIMANKLIRMRHHLCQVALNCIHFTIKGNKGSN